MDKLEGDANAQSHAGEKDLSTLKIDLRKPCSELNRLSGVMDQGVFRDLPDGGKVDEDGVGIALNLAWESPELHVYGALSCRIEIACSRCLARYELPLEVAVERLYRAGRDPAFSESEVEMVEDTLFLEDGTFSLRRMVEEELLLALPMVPLCNEACAGLCAGCGADLNKQPCCCETEAGDGPFAALKSLKLN